MLEAIISFFPSEAAGAIGALEWTAEERRKLAVEVLFDPFVHYQTVFVAPIFCIHTFVPTLSIFSLPNLQSKAYCCPICGNAAELLLDPSADVSKPDAAIAEQVAQLHFSKPSRVPITPGIMGNVVTPPVTPAAGMDNPTPNAELNMVARKVSFDTPNVADSKKVDPSASDAAALYASDEHSAAVLSLHQPTSAEDFNDIDPLNIDMRDTNPPDSDIPAVPVDSGEGPSIATLIDRRPVVPGDEVPVVGAAMANINTAANADAANPQAVDINVNVDFSSIPVLTRWYYYTWLFFFPPPRADGVDIALFVAHHTVNAIIFVLLLLIFDVDGTVGDVVRSIPILGSL
jgi:hypothetical protein